MVSSDDDQEQEEDSSGVGVPINKSGNHWTLLASGSGCDML